MDIWVNPDGTRNRLYRPLIQLEWLNNQVTLYNPHQEQNFGLYSGAQPSCKPFVEVWDQFGRLAPVATVDPYGRMHRTPVTRNYQPLRENVSYPPAKGSY